MCRTTLAAAVALLLAASPRAETYRTPPDPIPRILDAPRLPFVTFSPDSRWMLELRRAELPSIEDLSRPWIPLAGRRLDPATNGPAREVPLAGLALREVRPGAPARELAFPAGTRIRGASFTTDSRRLMITTLADDGIELWTAEVADGAPRRLTGPVLNAALGAPCDDLPGDGGFLCRVVPEGRGPSPVAPVAPEGPLVEESRGRKAANRTYQNLLKTPHDERLFDHHATSELVRIGLDGSRARLAGPAVIVSADPSVDGRFVLVETVLRPYSTQVPVDRFPRRIEVIDREGRPVRVLAELPLADDVPITFDSVRKGPRRHAWRQDRPATLTWVEALDGGDGRAEAAQRDAVFQLDAPFTGEPAPLWRSEHRFSGLAWARADLALATESLWKTRRTRTWRIDPSRPDAPPVLLIDRSSEDAYTDPGSPAYELVDGGWVLRLAPDGRHAYFTGEGASDAGLHPFLDRMDLSSGKATRLWQSKDPWYESVVEILDDDARRFVTRRQSPSEPPNFMLRMQDSSAAAALTAFPDPAPEFASIQPEILRYRRDDGVELSGKLYVPAGWTPEKGRLPVLLWAYPQEFKDKDAAGRVTTSPNLFARPGGASHLFLLTQGWAVLDGPSLPIVGEGEAEPNDTYVTQLVAGARAAVDELVRRGVGDRARMAIGGHSYGAFTAANLLAHSDLFRAGIARSGAYNRTLTPFGFQGEERNFWEASGTYVDMSPFTHAAKIDEPLLLIHGQDDSNPGTFPVQSERLYAAIKGLGGTARWVVLPKEEHGYGARESVGHALWEMTSWLDEHVAKPAPSPEVTVVRVPSVGEGGSPPGKHAAAP